MRVVGAMACRRGVALVVAMLALTGCRVIGLSPPLDLDGQRRATLAPVAARGVPLRFGEITFGVRRGQEVGAYVFGLDCFSPWTPIVWRSGQGFKQGQNFNDLFYEALTDAGYDVTGGPAHRFDRRADHARARYAVSARVVGMALDLCREKSFWTNAKLGESGDGRLRVEWAVYDIPGQRIVGQMVTEGHGHLDEPLQDGDVALAEMAFASAATALALDPEFLAVLSATEAPSPAPAQPVVLLAPDVELPPDVREDDDEAVAAVVEEARSDAPAPGPADWPEIRLRRRSGGTVGAVVTAAGLMILGETPDGGVLALAGGAGTPGAPVERVDRARGVALVRVPGAVPAGVPLRTDPPEVGETVRVVTGSGVAAGIVAAVRPSAEGTLILVDGATSDGAVLVDEVGRVLAIATGGGRRGAPGQDTQGLARFVPVGEALAALKVSVDR